MIYLLLLVKIAVVPLYNVILLFHILLNAYAVLQCLHYLDVLIYKINFLYIFYQNMSILTFDKIYIFCKLKHPNNTYKHCSTVYAFIFVK